MNIVSSKHRLWVERHMDQANCKVGWGQKNSDEEKISFNSAQILVSSQRSWPSPNSVLGWTQYMIAVFSEKEKRNSSIGWESKHLFSIPVTIRNHSLHLFFNFVFACEQNWSWQRMVHVNYLNNSFSLCWITLRLLAVKSCHSLVTVKDIVTFFFHGHEVNPRLSHINELMVLSKVGEKSSPNPNHQAFTYSLLVFLESKDGPSSHVTPSSCFSTSHFQITWLLNVWNTFSRQQREESWSPGRS